MLRELRDQTLIVLENSGPPQSLKSLKRIYNLEFPWVPPWGSFQKKVLEKTAE
jgi:hypothetical protein|tara:strand:+ start:4530 stop:4688 length:159 start_codon:yes stop_codon:yes gene_type:complete